MSANQAFSRTNFGDYYSGGAGGSAFFDAPGLKAGQFKDFDYGDFSWDKEGKFNETAENLKKDPLGKSGSGWGQALGIASSFLQEAKDKGKKDDFIQKLPYALGSGSSGFGGQLLDNLGVVMPNQHAPIVIPGVQTAGGGSSGTGSKIGRFAGAALGAVLGGPAGMTIGATLGGGAGSFFD